MTALKVARYTQNLRQADQFHRAVSLLNYAAGGIGLEPEDGREAGHSFEQRRMDQLRAGLLLPYSCGSFDLAKQHQIRLQAPMARVKRSGRQTGGRPRSKRHYAKRTDPHPIFGGISAHMGSLPGVWVKALQVFRETSH